MLKNLPMRLKMIAIYATIVAFTIPVIILFDIFINWTASHIVPSDIAAVDFVNTLVFAAPYASAIYIAVYAIVIYMIGRTIAKQTAIPLNKMIDDTRRLAEGDIDVSIRHDTRDEVGRLAQELQKMVEAMRRQANAIIVISGGDLTGDIEIRSDRDAVNNALQQMLWNNSHMLADVSAAADQIASGSKQIADGASALAQGSTQQAASIEELSSAIAEIAGKTEENAQKAEEAAKLAVTIKESADKGSNQMTEMIEAVRAINEASSSISKVIKAIDEIAFQTNILALNAAVEAARAGQHGKGFAIVADEVRTLAAKSATAANDSQILIRNSIEKANLGVRIADETATSLQEIISGINESSQLIDDIATLSEEQSHGVAFINDGIDQIVRVVSHNSATSEESAAASEEMSSQTAVLKNHIARFRLKH